MVRDGVVSDGGQWGEQWGGSVLIGMRPMFISPCPRSMSMSLYLRVFRPPLLV